MFLTKHNLKGESFEKSLKYKGKNQGVENEPEF